MKDYLIEYENFTLIDKLSFKLSERENNFQSTVLNTAYNSTDSNNPYQNKKENIFFEIYINQTNPNITLICTNQQLINIEFLDNIVKDDQNILFLSKHASKNNIPALTSHCTGNFSISTPFGGRPFELGNAYPTFQKEYMKNLYIHNKEIKNYDITIEASHHGPTHIINPILFIEIGSTELEWNNKFIASLVCKTILKTINELEESKNKYKEKVKTVIGIGGNHYPKKFNDLILFSNIAFAAIMSKYNIPFLNARMLEEMNKKSIERIESICIDEKGLGSEKIKVLKIIKSQDVEIISV